MGLFDRKKKVREPEPLPGQPPISTSRPRQSLQKQNPHQQQQQQQQRGQQISDPILYDPSYQAQQGGGPFGSRSRGSVIQEERGGGGGQQQWDPPQRSAQFENQRNSVASDRDWTLISPQTGFAQANHTSQTSSPTSQLVPGSSPPLPHAQNSSNFYDVPPGSIFPSHQLPPSIVPPPSGAHGRYATTGSNQSHNGSREDLPYRSVVVPPQQPQLVPAPPQSTRQQGGAPGSYDGSHDSSHGLSSGRPEVTTPGSMREGSARFRAGGETGSVRGDLDARDRQGSGDSVTPMRPPRAQPPPPSSNPMAQQPSSNSHHSIVNLPPSSPPPPPPPPPPIGQHAKIPSFSSANNLQAISLPPVVTQIYDSPSYAAPPPSSRAQQQPPPPPSTATNIDPSRYSVGPPPPPPPPPPLPSGQQHPHHRSQDWSAGAQQQQNQQQARLSQQPPPTSVEPSPYSNLNNNPSTQQQPYPSNPTSYENNNRYSQQPPRQPNSDYVHYQPSLPPTPLSSAGNGNGNGNGNWRPSIDQQSQPVTGGKKEKGEKKKFGFLPQWSGRSEADGDEEGTKSSKKTLKKEMKERDREYASSDAGHGNGNGMLPKGWKEEDVEETISSLSHLPPHAFQSSSEHLAFTSQIDDLTHRLQNDPTNGTLAEKTARQLRKEIKNLPSEIEKEGSGAAGSVAELWWKLMWTGDAKIMRLCSNQKFLSNLESSFKKLPASSQQKIDIYHVFGVITETFRGSNGSEDLEKYFSKVYENANESGLNRSTPPQYLQALSAGQDRQRGRSDGQGERRHRASGFPSSENVPTVGDDLERMARECEGAWKTKEDLLQLLRDARNDEGVMNDPEMRARIRESYQACFHIETELVNHRPWAESQATESLLSAPPKDSSNALPSNIAAPLQPGGGPKLDQQPPDSPGLGLFQTEIKDTRAQIVLRRLMEVTAEVSEALEAFHEWEREMQEDEEMRIISERSRKETRHDRSKPIQTTDNLLTLPTSQAASASRSPSPIRTPLWDENAQSNNSSSPRLPPLPNLPNPILNLSSKSIPIPLPPHPPSSHNGDGFTPRSGSPELLPPPPRGPNDPALIRSASPGSRPLPVPEKTKGKGFMGMLGSGVGGGGRGAGVPVVNGDGGGGATNGLEGMSEKARGKMRVIDAYEADDAFDPDDIYKTSDPNPNNRPSTPTSIHSSLFDDELADDWVPPKPITYVYDAALERKVFLEEERKREALRALKAKGRGSSYVEAQDVLPSEQGVRPDLGAPATATMGTMPSLDEASATTGGNGNGGAGGRLEREKEMGRMLSGVGGTNGNGNGNGHPTEKEHSGGGATGLGRKMSFWKKSGNRVASDGSKE